MHDDRAQRRPRPARRPCETSVNAIDTYLEIAAEVGLLGLGALALLVGASVATALGLLRHRRNQTVRAAAFAALMTVACLAAHSTVEFSLQIPAVAVMASVMLALPFAGRAVPSRRHRHPRSSQATSGPVDAGAGTGRSRQDLRPAAH